MSKWTDSFSSGWATLILEVSESGTSAATNKGTISWSLKIRKDSSCSSYNLGGASISVTIGGTKRWSSDTFDIRSLSVGSTKVLKSGEFTATHKTDGTLSLSCSASFVSGVGLGNAYISDKTFTGTKIARKSTLGVAAGNTGVLGTVQNFTISENDSSFKHRLYYTCGTHKSYILGSESGSSDTLKVSWTPPFELASQEPNGSNLSAKFVLETYSGSTLIGSNSYTVKLVIPISVKPTISFSVSDAASHASYYGAYIQSKSKFAVAITASGAYGSTIKSYKITADGKTYTSSSVTTDVISGSGLLAVEVSVTDSRGVTVSTSEMIDVLAYAPPKITDMKVKRSNADGTSNPTGAYLTVNFSTQVTPLNNKNGVGFIVQYKKVSESSFTSKEVTAYTDNYNVTSGNYTFPADTSSSYNVRLSVADHFVGTIKEGSGSTAAVLFSWMKKGLGWAFGKVAELEDTLDVNFKGLFRKNVTFYGDLYKNPLGVGTDEPIHSTKVLYDSTGSVGTITLNETAANFTYLEIIFGWQDMAANSVKVNKPNGRTFDIGAVLCSNSPSASIARSRLTISGTTITQTYNGMTSYAGSWSYTADKIYIKTVIGHR